MEHQVEDIFYSDDELSESELYPASSFASKYFSGKSESIFSNTFCQNGGWEFSSGGVSLSNVNLNSSSIYNTIDRYECYALFGLSHIYILVP